VGQEYQATFDCNEPNNTEAYFSNGVLPPGLTLAGTGEVSGIPTTPGRYELSGFHCTFNGGYGGYFPNAHLTFIIQPAPTPTPILTAHSLNTSDCSFYVGFVFPATPDAGSVYLNIDNGSGNSIHAYAAASDQWIAGTLYGGTVTVEDLNNSSGLFGLLLGIQGDRAYKCGDSFNFSVGYQTGGAPVATQSVNSVVVDKPAQPDRAGGYPTLKLLPLKNANCEFRVVGYLPSTPKPGTTKLTIASGTGAGGVVYTIDNQTAGEVMDFTFNPQTVFNGTIQDGIVSRDYQITSGSWNCGIQLYVSLAYSDSQDVYWATNNSPSASGYSITTGDDQNSNGGGNPFAPDQYTISASRSISGICSFSVLASVPAPGPDPEPLEFPMGIIVTSVDDPNVLEPYAAAAFVQLPEDGIITATLSLATIDDMTANVPLIYKSIANEESCAGYYRVSLAVGPGAILASSIFNLSTATCNSGYITAQTPRGCSEVERGFYTTDLNSSTPIACPAGMTTATTASKSVNDCYKPIVQSIVGLKAPKAIKFKATTNLAVITNTKAVSAFTIAGPCTGKLGNVTSKVKGKKVTAKMLKITAGKKAGKCTINLAAPASGKYLDLRQVVNIKVSKTGK
jgi:hypothetical protein